MKKEEKETNQKTTTEKDVVVEKKSKKKSSKKNKEELKTLIELVNETSLPRPTIILRLDINGYLNQFYEEEKKYENNIFIEPSISVDEFKKIIGG